MKTMANHGIFIDAVLLTSCLSISDVPVFAGVESMPEAVICCSVTILCRKRLFMSFGVSKCRQVLVYVGCRFHVVWDFFMAFFCRF